MNGQCARVLEVLSDGEGHSVTDIHARAGTMRLNSRVSELRNHLKERGETIVCTRAGGTGPDSYIYTIVPLEESTEAGVVANAGLRGSLPASLPLGPGHAATDGNRSASSGPAHDVEDLQLELDLIDRKLDRSIVVDSENARATRAILVRQKQEIEAKLA